MSERSARYAVSVCITDGSRTIVAHVPVPCTRLADARVIAQDLLASGTANYRGDERKVERVAVNSASWEPVAELQIPLGSRATQRSVWPFPADVFPAADFEADAESFGYGETARSLHVRVTGRDGKVGYTVQATTGEDAIAWASTILQQGSADFVEQSTHAQARTAVRRQSAVCALAGPVQVERLNVRAVEQTYRTRETAQAARRALQRPARVLEVL